MPTPLERALLIGIVVVLFLLAACFGWLLIARWRDRRTAQHAGYDDGYREYAGYEDDEDAALPGGELEPLPALPSDRTELLDRVLAGNPGSRLVCDDPVTGSLPRAGTRAALLSELADPCPSCGGDCTDVCVLAPKSPATIEGRIVDRARAIIQQSDEWQWDTLTGKWLAPPDAWEHLPREDQLKEGEPNWLREILVHA
jgi:hypothetical protein